MKKFALRALYGILGLAICASVILVSSDLTFGQDNKRASTSRDPFVPYKPPKPKPRVTQLQPPSIAARIEHYKSLRQAAMAAQQPAPKPTTAFLLSELQVVGLFRTPRGYAAMVEASPIKLSYVVYPGEKFYDGQLVAIEENRLVFRRHILWSDGRKEMVVETKPLRQPNAVSESLAVTKSANGAEKNGAPAEASAPEKQ